MLVDSSEGSTTKVIVRELFDAVATAAIPIINSFNTVDALAKMNHHHAELFDTVAMAAIPIIDTFNFQDLFNTANTFAKMNHHYPELFDTVATAVIPIIDSFEPQGLSNTVNAFATLNRRQPELFLSFLNQDSPKRSTKSSSIQLTQSRTITFNISNCFAMYETFAYSSTLPTSIPSFNHLPCQQLILPIFNK